MAEYSVTLYLNSGFNAVNIPDDVTTLSASSSAIVRVTPVEVLQDRFLSSVRINAEWDSVKDCDYARIGDFYYSVGGVKMLSDTTAELSLTPDFILSAGGTKHPQFNILDGITDRQTVSDDTFGKYTDPDPLTAPQKPLNLFTEWKDPGESATLDPTIYVATLLDLDDMATHTEGVTYTDDETGETVTVPKTYTTTVQTATILPDSTRQIRSGVRYYKRGDTTKSLNSSKDADTTITEGIAQARALGVENSITAQWSVPNPYEQTAEVAYPDINTETDGTDQVLQAIKGTSGVVNISFPLEYAEVKNKRALYGDYNRYGIMTCAGNSLEARPEEITTDGKTPPTVTYKTDPRPDGKPYFRFTQMNNNSEFWRNCIAGEQWEQVPLVYQGASGTALTRLNFSNSRASAELAQQQYNENYGLRQAGHVASFIDSGIGAITGMAGLGGMAGQAGNFTAGQQGQIGGYQSQIGGGAGGMASSLVAMVGENVASAQYAQTYAREKANELSQLYQATTVYTPTVTFPFNASILRDIKGNGVLIYRYEYQPEDLARIDKLLTMYGYKESEPLTLDNFSRRQKFDYVQCNSVTVTGKPRWWNDGIGDQLRNGIRIWHVKPDPSAYTDNPVKGA